MSRLQNREEYNENRHKKKRDKEHHKMDHVDDRHKRKHNEQHHKKEHKNNRFERKHEKNYHPESEFLNSFKTFIEELNSYVPLKNNVEEDLLKGNVLENDVEEKEQVLIKDDVLKNDVEEKEQDLIKDDVLENDVEEKEQDLLKDDVLKNDVEEKEQDLLKDDVLENDVEEKEQDLIKDDVLENDVEEKEQDLIKDDVLEKDVEEKEQDLLKDDVLEKDVEEKEQDLIKDDVLEKDVEEKEQDLFKDIPLQNKDYIRFEGVNNENIIEGNHKTIAKEEFYKNTYNYQVEEDTLEKCKATVTSVMLPLCENNPHNSKVIEDTVTVKIPVVLTESTVTITIESSLKLEDAVLQIKHIRKNVYLNHCKLISNSEGGKHNTEILFIDGSIRKNIEYIAKDNNDNRATCGKVKHATVKVPFSCTTRIMFNTYPKFKPSTYQDEVKILQTSVKVFDHCGEDITGGDTLEQSFKTMEFFNEKVFCELISAEIVESDILENAISKEYKTHLDGGFHDITEKVVLFLTIKLLQNQDIQISKKYLTDYN